MLIILLAVVVVLATYWFLTAIKRPHNYPPGKEVLRKGRWNIIILSKLTFVSKNHQSSSQKPMFSHKIFCSYFLKSQTQMMTFDFTSLETSLNQVLTAKHMVNQVFFSKESCYVYDLYIFAHGI